MASPCPPLFGFQARKRAGRVNQRHHGHVELFGQLHQAQGLAVALRIGHAEVAKLPLLGVVPFLLPNKHDGVPVNFAKAAHHRLVVAHGPVAVQLHKLFGHAINVIQCVRPVGMARKLHPLPARQVGVGFLFKVLDALFEGSHGFANFHVAVGREFLHFKKLAFKGSNGLFKVEEHKPRKV